MHSPQTETTEPDRYAPVEVDLKNSKLAGFLAWLLPGAGHIYQGRWGKGLLFMTCILVTYFWGLAFGGGHVVYASFRKPDVRYPYICQVAVGLPALPALVQSYRVRNEQKPLFTDWMAPPRPPVTESEYDQLAEWHAQAGFKFELGTLYTMVAGLLNVLAIYDAHSGPVFTRPDGKLPKDKPDDKDDVGGS